MVVHTREAAEDTLAVLAEHAAGSDSDPALLLAARALLDEVVERGYYISFAGNVTYKNALDLQEAAQARPGRPAAAGDRRALAHAGAAARAAQPAGRWWPRPTSSWPGCAA